MTPAQSNIKELQRPCETCTHILAWHTETGKADLDCHFLGCGCQGFVAAKLPQVAFVHKNCPAVPLVGFLANGQCHPFSSGFHLDGAIQNALMIANEPLSCQLP